MRRLAIGLPATRLTTSGAACGVVMRPWTGAPFFTDGGTTRLVSALLSLPLDAPPPAPGGIIGMPPPICPRAPAPSAGGGEVTGTCCDDIGTVPAVGVGGGPRFPAGVVAPANPAPPPPAPKAPPPPPAPSASPRASAGSAAPTPAPCPDLPRALVSCELICETCCMAWLRG